MLLAEMFLNKRRVTPSKKNDWLGEESVGPKPEKKPLRNLFWTSVLVGMCGMGVVMFATILIMLGEPHDGRGSGFKGLWLLDSASLLLGIIYLVLVKPFTPWNEVRVMARGGVTALLTFNFILLGTVALYRLGS